MLKTKNVVSKAFRMCLRSSAVNVPKMGLFTKQKITTNFLN